MMNGCKKGLGIREGTIIHMTKMPKIIGCYIKFLSILIFVLIGVIAFSCSCSRYMQQGRFGKRLARFLELVTPQSDLFIPIVSKPIDISIAGANSYDYVHEYYGEYEIDLVFPKLAMMQNLPKYPLVLNIALSCGEISLSNKIDLFKCNQYFSGHDGNGITFYHYIVPDQIPNNAKVRLTVSIMQPANEAWIDLGTPVIVVKKAPCE